MGGERYQDAQPLMAMKERAEMYSASSVLFSVVNLSIRKSFRFSFPISLCVHYISLIPGPFPWNLLYTSIINLRKQA